MSASYFSRHHSAGVPFHYLNLYGQPVTLLLMSLLITLLLCNVTYESFNSSFCGIGLLFKNNVTVSIRNKWGGERMKRKILMAIGLLWTLMLSACGLACKSYTGNGSTNMDGICGQIWYQNFGPNSTYIPPQPQLQQTYQQQQQYNPDPPFPNAAGTIRGSQVQTHKPPPIQTYKQSNCTSFVNGNVISTTCQ